MAETVADFFWKRLAEWGVKTILGYPGDGIDGRLGGLQRSVLPFAFSQVRHVEMAAFMAAADAKFNGEVGVCMATSGPGATRKRRWWRATVGPGASRTRGSATAPSSRRRAA